VTPAASKPEEVAMVEDVDVESARLAVVRGDVGVVAEVEAKVVRRWVAKGEGVREVRGGSSRRRER